jgi:hypothetical protein
MIKLDLGAGPRSPEGYTPVGNAHDMKQIFPLPYADGTVDAIRASHVLEHFPMAQVQEVVDDWVRALKPGGEIRIAVPDFDWIVRSHAEGSDVPTEAYLMGGQTDEADFHRSIFTRDKLRHILANAGLAIIRPWRSELGDDCSALPVSLNLSATKPRVKRPVVRGVMTMPRLGFNDMWNSAVTALPKLGIEFTGVTGAYWNQCLTDAFERVLAMDPTPDYLLAMDYDTVFTAKHVAELIQLAMIEPSADAIAALQSNRHTDRPLIALSAETATLTSDGLRADVAPEEFHRDLVPVSSAHFGLTLIRTAALRDLPTPWLLGIPDQKGAWGDGHTDPDMVFWRKWVTNGRSLYVAPRVVVGHLELVVRWPGGAMQPIFQRSRDWEATRLAPKGVWTGGLDDEG